MLETIITESGVALTTIGANTYPIALPAPTKDESGPTAPWEIEKWLVTIEAHCTFIADEPLTQEQVELLNCIRWNCADIRKAVAAD